MASEHEEAATPYDPTEALYSEVRVYRDAVALVKSFTIESKEERNKCRDLILRDYKDVDDLSDLFWAVSTFAYTIIAEHGGERLFARYFDRINKHELFLSRYLEDYFAGYEDEEDEEDE